MNPESDGDLDAVAALAEPLRRALYRHVVAGSAPVTRDEAAAALEVPRATAAFHLDRLASAGLLEVEYRRTTGRTGPGSGRPAKFYRPASAEVSVSIPPRSYELAGELLATAVEEADRSARPVRAVLAEVAGAAGRALGASAPSFDAALEQGGYRPRPDGAGGYELVNCPFHRLATSHTDLICQTNLCLLQGVQDGAADTEHEVVFAPHESHCCVRITARTQTTE